MLQLQSLLGSRSVTGNGSSPQIYKIIHSTIIQNTKYIKHNTHNKCTSHNTNNYVLNNYEYFLSPVSTEYILNCKRAILFLSSSKILIPHPTLRPPPGEWCTPPPLLRGEDRLARRRGEWGVNILEDERNRIALLQ